MAIWSLSLFIPFGMSVVIFFTTLAVYYHQSLLRLLGEEHGNGYASKKWISIWLLLYNHSCSYIYYSKVDCECLFYSWSHWCTWMFVCLEKLRTWFCKMMVFFTVPYQYVWQWSLGIYICASSMRISHVMLTMHVHLYGL